MKPVLLIAPLALLAACSPRTEAEPSVVAADAWCRPAAAGAPAVGCYVTLQSAVDDRLVAVQSPAAARSEIHTMSMDDGVMRMRALPDGLVLPAGERVALRPGAEHLMLIGPTGALDEGGEVALTLTFEKAPAQTLSAQ
ncbi:MAG: copper chaperone PCu(A)C, partial [Phenylobacterium sp.]|uniref:copper chaperone PCu(A)C n=1 Tax=Phenylobacterium sp. TaxID=1871053 RepID=UPI0027169F36